MSYDVNGTFTVLYNWATEAASPPIAISKLDTEFAGIATGLSSVYTKTLSDARYAALAGATFTGSIVVQNNEPFVYLIESDGPENEKHWRFAASSGGFYLQALDDANAGPTNPIFITRTSTTIDAIALTATAFTVNAIDLTPTKGNFTVEWATATSGGTTLESGTAYWKKVGNVVTMRLPALLGTTTAYDLYLRGIPAACQPVLTGSYTQLITVQGSVNGSSGAVTIMVAEGVAYWKVEGTVTAFSSGSAAKGVGLSSMGGGPTITYQVTD